MDSYKDDKKPESKGKGKVASEDKGGGDEDSGYIIPESFQREVQTMLKGCNKKQLAYVRECIFEKESEMRKDEFNDEGMPA